MEKSRSTFKRQIRILVQAFLVASIECKSIYESSIYNSHKNFKIKMNNNNSFFKGKKSALDSEA